MKICMWPKTSRKEQLHRQESSLIWNQVAVINQRRKSAEIVQKACPFLERLTVCLATSIESVPPFYAVKRPQECGFPIDHIKELTLAASLTNLAPVSSFEFNSAPIQ